ncbi:glucose-6-phosphate isomerase [Chloroflexota bacterium]
MLFILLCQLVCCAHSYPAVTVIDHFHVECYYLVTYLAQLGGLTVNYAQSSHGRTVGKEVDMERWRDPQWASKMTIRLDFSQMMSDFVGENRGISQREIDELIPRALEIAGSIEVKRKAGELGFYQLPYDLEAVDAVRQTASFLQGKCDDFIVLGIGGSALCSSALARSLRHPLHNLLSRSDRGGVPRFFVMDNIDPRTFQSALHLIHPERTVFNVISKSGTTAETLSQFLIIRQILMERIGKESVKEHLVVTTGSKQGSLKTLAEAEGYPLLSIPESVGGRFSALSTVGLFPAAMLGIDIVELLAGARYMDERCKSNQLWQNPAYLSGALHYLADVRRGLNIAVMMPYSDALIQVAYWFRQLWAESLGKAQTTSGEVVNVGQTPVVALGVTDQHSQLQLYMEGPFNKLVTFLLVENPTETMPIPLQLEQREGLSYLGGHSLDELMMVEAQATQFALTEAGRSSMSLIIPEINSFTIGQLLFLLEVQTIFTAGLYDINPMDQPGVEASKQYIYGMMGRSGFEDKARDIKEWQNRKRRYIS